MTVCGWIQALVVHGLNLLLSIMFARVVGQDTGTYVCVCTCCAVRRTFCYGTWVDECGVYFLTFVIDVTFGTFLIYHLLRVVESLAKRLNWTRLGSTGNYGNPPNLAVWGAQLATYVAVLAMMKVIVTIFLSIAHEWISVAATSMFQMFAHHRHLELMLVMVVGPCLLNSIQFWIIDTFLKNDSGNKFAPIAQDCTEF